MNINSSENVEKSIDTIFNEITNEPTSVEQETESPLQAVEEEEPTEEIDGEVEEDSDDVENEAQEEAEEVEAEPEDKKYFMIEGEKVTAETVKEWKLGNLRQSDYTKKTQELAEQRREVSDVAKLANARREEYEQGLEQIKSRLDAENDVFKDVNWQDLFDKDPDGAAVLYAKHDLLQKEKQKTEANLMRVKEQKAQEEHARQMQVVQAEYDKLCQADENFRNKEFVGSFIKEVASAYNATPEEVASIYDHRFYLMMKDALALKKAMTNKEKAETVKKPPVTLKSNSSSQSVNVKTKAKQDTINRLKRTGSVDDAMKVICGS